MRHLILHIFETCNLIPKCYFFSLSLFAHHCGKSIRSVISLASLLLHIFRTFRYTIICWIIERAYIFCVNWNSTHQKYEHLLGSWWASHLNAIPEKKPTTPTTHGWQQLECEKCLICNCMVVDIVISFNTLWVEWCDQSRARRFSPIRWNCRHYKFQINGEIPRDLAIIILTSVVSCFICISPGQLSPLLMGFVLVVCYVLIRKPLARNRLLMCIMCTHKLLCAKWKIPMNKVFIWYRQRAAKSIWSLNYRTTPVNNLFIDDIAAHTNEYVTK